jgi:hypothetical protein
MIGALSVIGVLLAAFLWLCLWVVLADTRASNHSHPADKPRRRWRASSG